jgi:hypothetical protein
MLPPEWRHKLNLYARRGGKTSRRRTVRRIEAFVAWCGCQPEQIGRRHVYAFLEQPLAQTTRRDYYYAILLLWELLGRPVKPPMPSGFQSATPDRHEGE